MTYKSPFQTFFFKDYQFHAQTGVLQLQYALDHVDFCEIWQFPVLKSPLSLEKQQSVNAACEMLWLLAGVSYFKAGIPPNIAFTNEKHQICPQKAEFIRNVWLNGLGEFFFVNNLDPFVPAIPVNTATCNKPANIVLMNRTLIPLGGGKDSLATVLMHKNANKDFATWTVNQTGRLQDQIDVIGGSHVAVTRKICPNLLLFNNNGVDVPLDGKKSMVKALNGHVPVTMILSAAAVITALLLDYQKVAISSEKSASFGNITYKNHEINHQWSKSAMAVQQFTSYVQNFIGNVQYVNLLGKMSETKIVQYFVEHGWELFKDVFSSCNRNFHIKDVKDGKKLKWCANCPKCAFVFAMLAPFVPKNDLLELFGENLFEKKSLKGIWQGLLGEEMKPFECVGTPEEVLGAVSDESVIFRFGDLRKLV